LHIVGSVQVGDASVSLLLQGTLPIRLEALMPAAIDLLEQAMQIAIQHCCQLGQDAEEQEPSHASIAQ
jgi:hypothetical protein